MTFEDAQSLAVVATAQLLAAMPWLDSTVEVQQVGRSWSVLVRWDGAVDVRAVETVLDGPPPGIVLVHDSPAH